MEFDQAYIFKYSPRRDTPAAAMPDQVPEPVREERNQRLLEPVNEIAGRRYRQFVGRQMQILVEGPSKKNPARLTGRTRCNKIVVFDGGNHLRGKLMDVKSPAPARSRFTASLQSLRSNDNLSTTIHPGTRDWGLLPGGSRADFARRDGLRRFPGFIMPPFKLSTLASS